jgi:outer membrane protein assembly factor BamE (lipoprotein component of BamABCDE complex)
MKQFALLCACLMLSGCLVMSQKEEKVHGKYVPASTFDQIEAGKTSAAWVKATLGEPTSVTKVEGDATEIWKYSYTERRESNGAVFLLFAGSDVKERPHAAIVEIRDGVVIRKWRT